MTKIKFGTSGWRGVMAEDFTFANVRRAVTGIGRYVSRQKPNGARLVIARDPRFLGETFCGMAAEIVAAHGITPLVAGDPAPTPAIAFEVVRVKTDGAINFTASHNPPEYNGVKFSTPDGAPALPEVTKQIEAEIESADQSQNQSANVATSPRASASATQQFDRRAVHLKHLHDIVVIAGIDKSGMRVAFDPLWDAAHG